MTKNNSGGYVAIYRQIFKDPLYFEEPFTKASAWMDLILVANHQLGGFFFRKIWIEVKRGQVGYSVKTLAKRWVWSRNKTERFLKWLENDTRIVRQKTNITTVISILNYDKWQKSGHGKGTQQVTQTGTQTDINKKENKKEESRPGKSAFSPYPAASGPKYRNIDDLLNEQK